MGFDLDGGTRIMSLEESPVMIWPNPARESVTIAFDSGAAGTIEAVGADGRAVRAWPSTGAATMSLDLIGLAPGPYVLRMRDGDRVRALGALMKE